MKKRISLLFIIGCLVISGCAGAQTSQDNQPKSEVESDEVSTEKEADTSEAKETEIANTDHEESEEVKEGNGTENAPNPIAEASETYIDKISFDSLPSFQVTSENLKDGVWDTIITKTEKGENLSPQLSWDEVEGASSYAVFMIDGGWLHMDLYTTETSVAQGELEDMPRGHQYVGPYPPSGTHTYSIFVFALKNDVGKVKFMFNMGGNSIDMIYQGHDTDVDENTGNVLAYARLDGNYTYGD